MTRGFIVFFAIFAAASVWAQGVYKWTDENGKVHYGAEPPRGAQARPVQERINSYGGPPQVQRVPTAAPQAKSSAVPSPAPSATGPVQVVMYATSWCGYCKQARNHFTSKGIAYVEHDVEKSSSANAEFKRLGGKGVPLIVVGREMMRGFSPESFDTLFASQRR